MELLKKFFFKKSKPVEELNISDALVRKKATIQIGGKVVTIEAFKVGQMFEGFALLKITADDFKAMLDKPELLKDLFSARLPEILEFCCPNSNINIKDVTATEFMDLIVAVWCVNDLERIITNFTLAMPSTPQMMQLMASLPK